MNYLFKFLPVSILSVVLFLCIEVQPSQKIKEKSIGQYVVEVFEDTRGNLWIGTVQYGVAKYDGQHLTYFTKKDGLSDDAVVDILEDNYGNIWFATHAGLTKYDGYTFKNYNNNTIESNRLSELMIDTKGRFWVGTWGGVFQFKNESFEPFPLPKPNIEVHSYQSTMHWISEIFEDSEGNIWIGRDGYGACKYDGNNFTVFTKEEGLSSNNVHAIQQDGEGNIWFGSRIVEKDHPDPNFRTGKAGLNKFDGKSFTSFPQVKGLDATDVYDIFLDQNQSIWITSTTSGLYKYNNHSFQNHSMPTKDSLTIIPQHIFQDKTGTMWFGCSGGLYKMTKGNLIEVTQNGPWND